MINIDIDFEGYRHKEAFCLMKYASGDGSEVEWIWNSRDGVTPFAICNRASDKILKHVDWHLDRRILSYKPAACERIFVSLTEERARVKAEKKADILWNSNNSAQLQSQFGTKENLINRVLESYRIGVDPDLVEAGTL